MAIVVSQSDAVVFVANDRPEEGNPAISVTGARNTINVGMQGLRSLSGPAVVLTGFDNIVVFRFGTITSGGPVTVQGSDGRDTIINSDAGIAGEVRLGAGNDYYQTNFTGRQGAVRGGDGNDVLTQFDASRSLEYHGDAGDDVLSGGTADDRLFGGTDNDSLAGNAGADQLDGGDGADGLLGGAGNDTLDGGGGNDVAIFAGMMAEHQVMLSGGAGTVRDLDAASWGDDGTDTLSGIERLRFRDREIELGTAVDELTLATANQSFTNSAARYGFDAVTLAANGIQFVNTAGVRGTALAHTVLENGQYTQSIAPALEIAGDDIRVDNRAGATIQGFDTAIGPRGGIFADPVFGFDRTYGWNLQVVNAGTIRSVEGTAIEANNALTLTNLAGGLIAGAFVGVSIPNGSLTLTNAGIIEAGFAGIRAGTMDLVNTGTIVGQVESISRFSDIDNRGLVTGGFLLGGIDRLVNTGTVSGLIEVDVYQVGYGPGFGDTPSYQFASVDNRNRVEGDIRITGETQFRSAAAVAPVFTSVVANSGTVTGSIVGDAIVAALANDGTTPAASFREEVTNTGRIDGSVDLGAGDDLLVSAGSVGGAVRLGAGDDIVRFGGAVGGVLDGGAGVDKIDWSLGTVGGRFDLAASSAIIGGATRSWTGFEAVIGTGGADLLFAGAGTTVVGGAAGNDSFIFGATYDAADRVDGGEGSDVLAVQGNYALVLGAASLVGIETLTPLSGSDARFGDAANNRYAYALTTVDANVAAGQRLTVNASQLLAGEALTFDGSAETDGSFFLYGGQGTDRLTGGAGADVFFLAEGRFTAGDRFAGNGGADIVVLRGTVTATFASDTFTGIETVTLMSATDNRFFTGGTANSYAITSHDGNVAAGATLTVNGGALKAGEAMAFDGRAELDGSFRLFGGASADTLRGGSGADLIYGGLGGDTLSGGAGADTFRYQATAESTATARDTILDFATGDRIDLGRIDADTATPGDDAFSFIGAAAFTNVAGQLRASVAGGVTTLEADTNGDGIVDLSILLPAAPPLTAADFVL